MSEARRLRSLEEENGRLKWLVADQAVQLQILKEVSSKKWQARRRKGGRSEALRNSTWERSRRRSLRGQALHGENEALSRKHPRHETSGTFPKHRRTLRAHENPPR